MDFFNSLAQVAKNQKNFKTWEEEQANNNAQREELAKRRQYSKAELDAAKQLGETIIDVVDIMDNHSENVAENVETATQPIVAIAPFLTMFASGGAIGKKVIIPANKALWDLEEKLFWDDENARKLAQAITDDIHKTRPNKSGFYEWHFSSKKKVDAIRNPELKKQALEIHNNYMKEAKKYLRKTKGGYLGILGLTVASFIGANIYASSLQVSSSKIARYQARKILEDPKAFVKYTPEQIAQAKKYIEEHPELKKEKKKDKLKGGLFKSIIGIIKDRKAYKQSKLADSDASKKVSRQLSPEELKQAQKDKEVIQRSVRIINNEAEKYSENMEVAAGVIMGSTPIVGGFFGWLTGLVMNKTGLTDKIINNTVEKYGTDEAKVAFARFKELKPGAPGYTTRWKKFVGELLDDSADHKMARNGLSKSSKKYDFDEIFKNTKKLFAAGLSHRWGNAKIIGLIGAVVSAIPAALIALKLQKSAARAGRYTAKRELEKDPTNFIGYAEEDYKEVKDTKGKKQTFAQKTKEVALFVPTVLKQYYAYDKYKRNEFKDHQLLLDQLQKSEDISDEQLREAKNLQRKLFNTFEKVDDNSQIYSESMEAAVEIAQPFALYAGFFAMLSPFIYTAVQVKNGKLSAASVLEKVVDKLAKASNFLKSKTFTNYLNAVSENVSHKVGNVELKDKPIAALINGMDFKNDTIGELGTKLVKNIRINSEEFGMMPNFEQIRIIKKIESSIIDMKNRLDLGDNEWKFTLNLLKRLQTNEFDPKLRADMLNILVKNTGALQRMPDARFDRAVRKYVDIAYDALGEDNIKNLLASCERISKTHPEMEDFIYALMNRYGKYTYGDVAVFDPNAFKKAFAELIDKKTFVEKSDDIDKFFSKAFSKENFPYTLKEVPSAVDAFVDRYNAIMGKAQNKANSLTGNVDTSVPPPKSKLQESIDKMFSPKEQISKFKEKVEKMTDSEFQDWADSRQFSSMDKATMLKILPNVEKIIDNIPKEQLEKILGSLWKEFQKNPDEVIKLVSSGKVAQIFMTKGLVNTAAALGVSWFALNVLLTWAIQSWLADMQLKAGRLGVMKAMESLDDPAYYADIEPAKKQVVQAQSKIVADNKIEDKGNLLNKYKK
ncbi:hypothetical protein IKU74_00265 [bacterium]|nr:hypothetical protein [bacterium]